jgi:hypothetical protein
MSAWWASATSRMARTFGAEIIKPGLALDCAHWSAGRYRSLELTRCGRACTQRHTANPQGKLCSSTICRSWRNKFTYGRRRQPFTAGRKPSEFESLRLALQR